MTQTKKQGSTYTEQQRESDRQFVSEMQTAKDSASLILMAAKKLGIIDNDAPGPFTGYTQLSADEKAALSFEGVAEIGRPYGDPGKQALAIRAALKLQGTTVSEMSEAQLQRLESQAQWHAQRQQILGDFASRPEVQELEARIAQATRNQIINSITV